MKFPTFLTALCLFFSISLPAQIFDRFYMEQLRLWKTVELSDGSLVSVGSTPQNSVIIKTNRSGGLLSTKSLGAGFPNDLQLSGALYAVVGAKIMRLNSDLTTAWSVTVAGENFKRVRPLSNGQLLTLSDDGANRVSMHILNPQNGATILRKVLIDSSFASRVPEFTVVNNKIYALVNDVVWKFNLNGDFLGRLPFGMDNLFDISTATDQTLLVSRGESIIFKVDTLGRQIWRRDILHKSWSNTSKGGVLVVNEINTGRSTGEVSLLDQNGQLKWIRPIGEKTGELPFQARAGIQTKDENMLIVGNTFLPMDSSRTVRSRIIKLGDDNQVYLNRIVGNLYVDANANCRKDNQEKTKPYWIVVAKHSSGYEYYGMSDSSGRYSIRCDSGIYTLKTAELFLSPYRVLTSCPAQSRLLQGSGKTDTVDLFQIVKDTFGITSGLDCSLLKVDVGINTPIRCQLNTTIIEYKNLGTTAATNAYIVVELDPNLQLQNASSPYTNPNPIANRYYFNVGTLQPNSRNALIISTKFPCGSLVGRTVCVTARIFADTNCVNTSTWTGADIAVESQCRVDSAVFVIKNVGSAAAQNRKVIVMENNDIKPLSTISLDRQSTTTRSFPANGNTWRLTMEQAPNHPTSFAPTAFIEGCRTNQNQNIAVGFVQNFAADDRALSVAHTCGVLSGAYDPNDKTGYPFGYGDKHFIDQNQDIDYTVRFQNTGNDTAFKVVIRDTLDTRFLDLSSIEFGASSHSYEPTLYDKNILQFTFDNILLVDSFTNEPASNGYVRFRIKQKKDVLIGSKINNSVAIYFDYNPPIITNVSQHTVGKPIFLTTKIGEINGGNVAVQVSPNPFNEQTVFKIGENGPLSINGIFELFDVNGRLVRQANFDKNAFVLDRKDLPVGVYIFKIKTMDGRFNSGKVVVQ